MGILNITPDSFSDAGQYFKSEDAIHRALQIEAEGADILDIGAESTRPGSMPVSPQEEWQRLEPVLKTLQGKIKIPISVDTYHAEVAERVLQEGVEIINDVSQAADPALLEVVAKHQAGYVLMHCRGTPETMMQQAVYRDVVAEVRSELEDSLQKVLASGILPAKICLDPGFGFAKPPEQNYRLLQELRRVCIPSYPCLVGLSRKRMLREIAGENPALLKSAHVAATILALQQGASVLRVHDVLDIKAALNLFLCVMKMT